MTHLCINCNAPTVQRTGDTFRCEKCKYTWDVAHEQANAHYLETQGRQPAQSMGEVSQTLDAALGLDQSPVLPLREPQPNPVGAGALYEVPGEIEAPVYQTPMSLETLTVDELRDLAAASGVDLAGRTRKADIIAALREYGTQALAED